MGERKRQTDGFNSKGSEGEDKTLLEGRRDGDRLKKGMRRGKDGECFEGLCGNQANPTNNVA